ncbi:SURF1 family cytochrome oxidase biogenesis protein [Parerythrobacter jejuensis]|uniref:SURF1 family cytochrome oxidase biogenesis protein n=1 Tax=Parerythrobacter jejuensis TaxID=795812 RepID=UPI0018F8C3BF|nr:SURF1 family cytochrome oxidase biogenesis protein [Parerythrobacter jejuensis]
MTKNIPIIPTIIVVASVLTMIGLGIWQLGRADEKEALIASYSLAKDNTEAVAWPRTEEALEQSLFRRSELICDRVIDRRQTAGTSNKGTKGWAQIARCALDGGGEAEIALGWSRAPEGPQWAGGEVAGLIGPGPKLIADPPRAGLTPLAKPDPKDLPNNHLAYAGQWFFFALTALVIYFLALRKKRQDG